uniref:Uncharacterized protein n=1 Tax=Strombidium rassoulzadegani TaxID=1082188 RepID=A0A7S3CI13_9SPIT|mmetsp:Transcript_11157/g.18736  ORF Transcript_11157/g.18736 Transcript_11157/m.18736 type:complete len:413 (+) Transcript_11157:867-2105(+)
MKSGKFYCYFKPSYLMDNFIAGSQIDIPYFQVFQGEYREELEPIPLELKHIAQEIATEYKGIWTSSASSTYFDDAFKMPANPSVEFIARSDVKELKKKYKYGLNFKRPILLLTCPQAQIEHHYQGVKDTLKKHADMFDIYFIPYEKNDVLKREIDYLEAFIIDPEQKQYIQPFPTPPLDSEKGAEKKEPRTEGEFYYKKFFNIKVDELINEYLEGTATSLTIQDNRDMSSKFIVEVNSETFERDVIKNEKIDQFLLQIVKDGCQGCYYGKVLMVALSNKLKKHGLQEKLPIFVMDTNNYSPYIGNVSYTPYFLYVRKEGDKVVEIKTLESPSSQAFLDDLARKTGFEGFKEKIKIDATQHYINNQEIKDFEEDYNYDFETEDGYIYYNERVRLQEELRKQEEEKKADSQEAK